MPHQFTNDNSEDKSGLKFPEKLDISLLINVKRGNKLVFFGFAKWVLSKNENWSRYGHRSYFWSETKHGTS